MASPQANMEGIETEGSPSAGFVVVSKPGTVFIEARITTQNELDIQEIQEVLHAQLSSASNVGVVEMGVNIMADEDEASGVLGPLLEQYQVVLKSLKLVEYIGDEKDSTCYQLNEVNVKLQLYQLYDTDTDQAFQEHTNIPQARITNMPHIRFDGQWEELVFEDDLKGDLIWMITNILRFSQKSASRSMNPIILLHGPPGTGKTTLCQGLAQKISIRLNSTYKRTKLIQIKTAALLSKYYSESAKQVDQIFTTIAKLCEEDPERFICVLIDEVESIAFSREHSSRHGESQDSLRATNSLLTGLDRTKGIPNVIFLCTSNMLEALDTAFVDRCGQRIAVNPPSAPYVQYAIIRGRLQSLIDQENVLFQQKHLPQYENAHVDWVANKDGPQAGPGARILGILRLLRPGVSGRTLTQLPEQAILRYLRWEDCDLDLALTFMRRFIMTQMKQEIVVDSEQDAANPDDEGGRPPKRQRSGGGD